MSNIMFRLALVAGSILATSAYAQDRDRSEDFNGPYVGVVGGYVSQNNDRAETLEFDTNRDGTYGDPVNTVLGANAFSPGFCGGAASGTANADCRNDRDDFEYGARLGFDRRMGNFVVGVVLEGGRNEVTDSVSGFSTTPASYTFERSQDYYAQARLRAGYTPNGGILFYATGGGAWGRLENRFATTNTANSVADNGRTNAWGWSAGGGAEALLTDNLSLGLEYLYTELKDDDYTVNVGPGTALPTNPFLLNGSGTDIRRSDPNFRTHGIRASLNLRF